MQSGGHRYNTPNTHNYPMYTTSTITSSIPNIYYNTTTPLNGPLPAPGAHIPFPQILIQPHHIYTNQYNQQNNQQNNKIP